MCLCLYSVNGVFEQSSSVSNKKTMRKPFSYVLCPALFRQNYKHSAQLIFSFMYSTKLGL